MTADLFTRLAQRALAVPAAPGGGAGPSPLEAEAEVELPAAPPPMIVPAAAGAPDAVASPGGLPPAEPSIIRPATVSPDWHNQSGVAPGGTADTPAAGTAAGDDATSGTPTSDEVVVAVALVRPPSEPSRQPPSPLRTRVELTGAPRYGDAPADGTSDPPEQSVTVFARPRIDLTPPPGQARTDGPGGTGGGVEPAPPGPVVEITIDRVELRMARGAAPSRSAPASTPAPGLSLGDYLARRQEESR